MAKYINPFTDIGVKGCSINIDTPPLRSPCTTLEKLGGGSAMQKKNQFFFCIALALH